MSAIKNLISSQTIYDQKSIDSIEQSTQFSEERMAQGVKALLKNATQKLHVEPAK